MVEAEFILSESILRHQTLSPWTQTEVNRHTNKHISPPRLIKAPDSTGISSFMWKRFKHLLPFCPLFCIPYTPNPILSSLLLPISESGFPQTYSGISDWLFFLPLFSPLWLTERVFFHSRPYLMCSLRLEHVKNIILPLFCSVAFTLQPPACCLFSLSVSTSHTVFPLL